MTWRRHGCVEADLQVRLWKWCWRKDAVDSNDAGGLQEEAVLPRGGDGRALGAAEQLRGESRDLQSPVEARAGRDQQGARPILAGEGRPSVGLRPRAALEARHARSLGSGRGASRAVMAADADAPASPLRALVEVVARALVDQPDAVKVTESQRRGMTVVELSTAPGDMGKIIGRQGRTAAALRTLVAVTAEKHGTRAQLDIRD